MFPFGFATLISAHAIAKSLNLVTGPTAVELKEEGKDASSATSIVVVGSEMETFVEADWERVFSHKEVVFARTQPAQKQDIVLALNKRGHIVAMTGDGVKYVCVHSHQHQSVFNLEVSHPYPVVLVLLAFLFVCSATLPP
jgi:hypothetical protein